MQYPLVLLLIASKLWYLSQNIKRPLINPDSFPTADLVIYGNTLGMLYAIVC